MSVASAQNAGSSPFADPVKRSNTISWCDQFNAMDESFINNLSQTGFNYTASSLFSDDLQLQCTNWRNFASATDFLTDLLNKLQNTMPDNFKQLAAFFVGCDPMAAYNNFLNQNLNQLNTAITPLSSADDGLNALLQVTNTQFNQIQINFTDPNVPDMLDTKRVSLLAGISALSAYLQGNDLQSLLNSLTPSATSDTTITNNADNSNTATIGTDNTQVPADNTPVPAPAATPDTSATATVTPDASTATPAPADTSSTATATANAPVNTPAPAPAATPDTSATATVTPDASIATPAPVDTSVTATANTSVNNTQAPAPAAPTTNGTATQN